MPTNPSSIAGKRYAWPLPSFLTVPTKPNIPAQALALLALPPHLLTSLRELAALSDEILFLAGDISVDTSWYTKRASLSATYAAAELFMTQDTSTDFAETEAFLERRLEGARRTHEVLGGVGRWVGYQGMGVVNGLRSKGVRI